MERAKQNMAPMPRARTHTGGSPCPDSVLLGTQTWCHLKLRHRVTPYSGVKSRVIHSKGTVDGWTYCHGSRRPVLAGPSGPGWGSSGLGSPEFTASVSQASSAPGGRPVHTPTGREAAGLLVAKGGAQDQTPSLCTSLSSCHRRPSPGRQDPEL